MTTRITKKRKIMRSTKGGIRNLTRKGKFSNQLTKTPFKMVQKGGFFWTAAIGVLWKFASQALIQSDIIKLYAGYVAGYATQWITQIALTSNAMKGLVKTLKDKGLDYVDKGGGKWEVLEPKTVEKEALIVLYSDAVSSIELNQNLWLTNYDSWMSTLSYFVKNVNGIISSVAANIALNNDTLRQLRAAGLIRREPAVVGPVRGGRLNATRRQHKISRVSGGAGSNYTNPLPSLRNPPPSAEDPLTVAKAAARAAAAAAPDPARPPTLVKEATGEYDAQPWNKAILGYAAGARGMSSQWENYKDADTQYTKAIGQFKNIVTNVKTELATRATRLATKISAFISAELAKKAQEMKKSANEALAQKRLARNEANIKAATQALAVAEAGMQELVEDWGKKQESTGEWVTNDEEIIELLNIFKDNKVELTFLQDKLRSIGRTVNFQFGGAFNNDPKYSEILDDLVEMMMIIWKNTPLKEIEKEIKQMENDPNSNRLMLNAYRVSKAKMFNEPMPKIVGGAGKTGVESLNSNKSFLVATENFKTTKMELTIAKTRDTVTYLRSITVDGLLNLVVWTKTYIEMGRPDKVIDIGMHRNIIAEKMFDALILFISNMLQIQQAVCPIIQAVYPGVKPIEKQIGKDFSDFMNTALGSNVFSKDYDPDKSEQNSENFSSWEESITDIRNILDCREKLFVKGAPPPPLKSEYFEYWKEHIEPAYQNMKSGSVTIQSLLTQRKAYDKAAALGPEEANKFLQTLKARSTNLSSTLQNAPNGIKPLVEASVRALNSNPFLKPAVASLSSAAPAQAVATPVSAERARRAFEVAKAAKEAEAKAAKEAEAAAARKREAAGHARTTAAPRQRQGASFLEFQRPPPAAVKAAADQGQPPPFNARAGIPKASAAARPAATRAAAAAARPTPPSHELWLSDFTTGGSLEALAMARNSAYNRRRDAIESKNVKRMSGGGLNDKHFIDYFGDDMIKKYYGNNKITEKIDSSIPLLIPVVDGHEAEKLLDKVLLEPTEEEMNDFESIAAIIKEDLEENRLNNINNTLFQGGRYRF